MTDFEKIYRAYFNDVYLYIRRLSKDEHIAEEITSETFFKAMNSIDKFRGDCDVRVWLCQIAKNSFFSYCRKHRDVVNLEDQELQNEKEPIEERLENQYDAIHIQKLLHEMSEPYKEVFMWRVYAEMSFKQIGEMFNKTDNWACVTYHRAKSMIRKRMEDEK